MHTPVVDLKALYEQNPNRNRVVLHVDANCFYASVECLYNPDMDILKLLMDAGVCVVSVQEGDIITSGIRTVQSLLERLTQI